MSFLLLPAVVAGAFALTSAQSPAESGSADHARVDYVVSQLIQNGLSREDAEAFFRDPRLQTYPPREVQAREIDWDQVIARLVAPQSVKQGVEFADQYAETLARAESEFGVPLETLAALLKLESNFGKNSGNYVAFNIFYTILLQNEQERRWKRAGDNLASLVALCRKSGQDCFEIRGSYGGALGPAQFLPVSVMLYGRDGDGDNIVNPFRMDDAIFSAANFLVEHGWRENPADALGKYYGTNEGYPRAVLAYAEALKRQLPARSAEK